MHFFKIIFFCLFFLAFQVHASSPYQDIQALIDSGKCDEALKLIHAEQSSTQPPDFLSLLKIKAEICNGNYNANTYGYGLFAIAGIEKRSSETGVKAEDINELRDKLLAIGGDIGGLSTELTNATNSSNFPNRLAVIVACIGVLLFVLKYSRKAFFGLIILVVFYLFISLVGAAAQDMCNNCRDMNWKIFGFDMFFVKGVLFSIGLFFSLIIIALAFFSAQYFLNWLIQFLESVFENTVDIFGFKKG